MKRFLAFALAILLTFGIIPFSAPQKIAANNSVVDTWTGGNGDLFHYHKSTKGKGVPIIIMPVHFGPDDLAAGGKLQTAGKWAADVILGADAFSDLMDYFDVYIHIESCPQGIFPVPQNGYVESFGEKYEKARQLTTQRLGKNPSVMRMIYLGNSDQAGQVGGHAYGGAGALLTWGNQPGTSTQ